MKNRQLTSEGDYSFGSGIKNYISGVSAIAQAIKTKILLFYGEWWEDIGVGIPMFQSIVGQTDPVTIKNSLSMLLQERIQQVSGVSSIDSINISVENRTINPQIIVTTSDSETAIVEVTI